MKKRIIFIILMIIGLFVFTGCDNQNAIDFKKEYEDVNGKTLKDDIKYRSLEIDKDNPYVKVSIDDIATKLKNKETFYLYVGDSLCPWCRSGLEKMIEVAKKENIETIYYVDFWDDNHNEILRDLYEIENEDEEGNVTFKKTRDAEKGYDVLLDNVSDYVQDYTIMKDGKEYNVGVKRVYGGDHFYFENGKCQKYVSLRSDKLANANDELTKEVLKDQESKFTSFFTSKNVCTGNENC